MCRENHFKISNPVTVGDKPTLFAKRMTKRMLFHVERRVKKKLFKSRGRKLEGD